MATGARLQLYLSDGVDISQGLVIPALIGAACILICIVLLCGHDPNGSLSLSLPPPGCR